MNKHEIATIIENVEESQIPSIITDQFNSLQILRKNVAESTKKAQCAQLSAQQAKNKSAGLFHKKEAIESLQNATADLADAQISSAQAQEVSFEYQQKLGEITKYLFGLGVTNIAMNRTVVRELEMRLRGASEEELGELERQEIMGVVKQLKAQEDIMKKQSDLANRVKKHEGKLTEYEMKDKEHDALIEDNKKKTVEHDKLFAEKARKDESQDEEIARQAAKDEELGRRIDEGEQRDKSQDEEIARQAAKDEELGKRIDEGELRDRSQDEEIIRQAAKDEELGQMINKLVQSNLEKETQINELKAICENLSSKIESGIEHADRVESGLVAQINEKASKNENLISYAIGIIALFVAFLQFFI